MRTLNPRPDRLCPEEARETAKAKGPWGQDPVRVLDALGDRLGWRVAGTQSSVVYDKDPFQVVVIIRASQRLRELPEAEGDVIWTDRELV